MRDWMLFMGAYAAGNAMEKWFVASGWPDTTFWPAAVTTGASLVLLIAAIHWVPPPSIEAEKNNG